MIARTFALAAAMSVLIAPAFAAEPQMITKEASGSVSDVAERLVSAVEEAGAMMIARVDHQANAASVDTEMAPTTLVIFGNPQVGTPIIMSDRRAGLDLPVRVLIWDEGGTTQIGYLDPAALSERYDLDEAAMQSVEMMSGALERLTDGAASAN